MYFLFLVLPVTIPLILSLTILYCLTQKPYPYCNLSGFCAHSSYLLFRLRAGFLISVFMVPTMKGFWSMSLVVHCITQPAAPICFRDRCENPDHLCRCPHMDLNL